MQLAKSVFENSGAGSTGHWPVPSGDSPDGGERPPPTNEDRLFLCEHRAIPVGGSPTGTGESPVPPIFQTRSKKKPASFLLYSALLVSLCRTSFADVKTGDAFPDLTSFKLEGKLPDALKGKVVIVDFWASWCGPCKESFPVMNELSKKYADKGLVILAVNEDEVRADMEHFLKENAAAFTVVRDASQKLADKVGIGTMPSSFVIDKEGKVRFVHSGFHGEKTRKEYLQQIESLLGK